VTAYNVRVNVTIQQADRTDGMYIGPNSYLNYSTDWVIEGENLADIAPKIDGLVIAMKAVHDDGTL
jgi:hypothetical protein